jgi:hypothetical protein
VEIEGSGFEVVEELKWSAVGEFWKGVWPAEEVSYANGGSRVVGIENGTIWGGAGEEALTSRSVKLILSGEGGGGVGGRGMEGNTRLLFIVRLDELGKER